MTLLLSIGLPNTALPPPGIGGPQMGSNSAAQSAAAAAAAAAILGLQRCGVAASCIFSRTI